jgi:hypothetical protein
MDSIRSGGVQEQQTQKRNLYFEKLSQQLKELQGESTPTTIPKEDEAEAVDEQQDQVPPGSINGEAPALAQPEQIQQEQVEPTFNNPQEGAPIEAQEQVIDNLLDDAGL